MAELERISPDWSGEPCIVAAPGPSLTDEVVKRCRMKRWFDGWRIIAVQDSYRLMPFADALYGCDSHWWNIHKTCDGFAGERWSTHAQDNEKLKEADAYGLRLVAGKDGDRFSFDPGLIYYGSNSGFQAVNLALLKGCRYIVLVGFDMRVVEGKRHFFGDHPKPCHNGADYGTFARRFDSAAVHLPGDVRIVNATPGSALRCFPMMDLEAALADTAGRQDGLLHRDGTERHSAAG